MIYLERLRAILGRSDGSARSESEDPGRAGRAPSDDVAVEEEIRRAFLSPVGIEPAVLGRRSLPTVSASREPAADEAAEDAPAAAAVTGPGAAEPVPDAPPPGAPPRRNRRVETVATPVTPGPPTSPEQPAPRPSASPTPALGEASPTRGEGPAPLEPPTVARRSRVPLVAGLLAVGVVLVVSGTLLVGSLVATRAPEDPSSPPTAGPSASGAPTATLPAGVTAGLLEVAVVNERLASATVELDAALQARRPSASVIGPLFRTIAASVRSGQAAAQRVADWPVGGSFAGDAVAFYRAVGVVAADGLAAPLRDDAAYARSGRQMLELLASLPEITAAARTAAARAGVALPTPTGAPTPMLSPPGGG